MGGQGLKQGMVNLRVCLGLGVGCGKRLRPAQGLALSLHVDQLLEIVTEVGFATGFGLGSGLGIGFRLGCNCARNHDRGYAPDPSQYHDHDNDPDPRG